MVPVANARCASLAAKIAAISAFDGLGVGRGTAPMAFSFKEVTLGETTCGFNWIVMKASSVAAVSTQKRNTGR